MKQIVKILDGATGTILQNSGIAIPEIPETLNMTQPDLIESIARDYAKAGSQIVYANTFGANPLKFQNSSYSYKECIQSGIVLARKGAPACKIALDIGPLGQLMEPMGSFTFEEAYDQFKEIVLAGKEADLIVIETMSDLYETKAALLAAKEHSDLPVFVTMSFEENERTFTGCTLESMAKTLEALGANAIGFNCSIGPKQMIKMVEKLSTLTSLPIIAKPNAGLPDPSSGTYTMSASEFYEHMESLVEAGASYIGGCCGTSPIFIEQIAKLKGQQIAREEVDSGGWVCSPLYAFCTKGIHPIGERLNPTGKKRFQQALLEEDLDYIVSIALEQKEAGADLLDVNVGHPGVDEVKMLPKLVKRLQSVIDLPLMLDSSNPNALEAGARVYNGICALNSVSAEKKKMQEVMPIAQKYGCSLVCLCLDEEGIPNSAKKRVELAHRIAQQASQYHLSKNDLWFDPLTLTVSSQPDQAIETLDALKELSKEGYSCVLGVSNISFGLPARQKITQAFLAQSLYAGLNLPIINVNVDRYMDTIVSSRLLLNEDLKAQKYIERFHALKAEPQKAMETLSLQEAIYRGLGKQARLIGEACLKTMKPLEVVERELIPSLDRVGNDYEAGILYLPQLLSSAKAAQEVFGCIKEHLAKTGEKQNSKGTIVLATVEGDIHDIGKNIVKTVLENYGYTIIDLGRDVPAETIVETVKANKIRLVGLSALMTTTLPAMEKTIQLLHQLECPPKIMVGGAVLTPQYANEMQADYYSKDAQDGVRIAKEVFENV
ncbi:homocysteine S-methyltransferase family protein [Dubosiella newyorkensis]|uniref:homocysteine S-methyltransferase family protein n=2 Tax=Dubosiella newyorkensis TaxID=1862672 RepID=UPI00248B78DE|nr:homocysteine S-methyltransferase family protein [Dubosiella newyorkensis]